MSVTIYDLEISDERWDSLVGNLDKIDNSRNDGKKHYAKLGLILADELLDDEINDLARDIESVKRKLKNLEGIINE